MINIRILEYTQTQVGQNCVRGLPENTAEQTAT